jgi:hypothetical protein
MRNTLLIALIVTSGCANGPSELPRVDAAIPRADAAVLVDASPSPDAAASDAEPDAAILVDADLRDADLDDVCPTAPMARQTVANIAYHVTLSPSSRVNGVDLTSFDAIWGRSAPTSGGGVSSIVPWPGAQGTTPIFDRMQTDHYIAARFHVPIDMPTTASGTFYDNENFPSTATLAISPRCGDFAPAAPNCIVTGTTGGSLGRWKLAGSPVVTGCLLEPGHDYYVNLRAGPTSSTQCSGTSCLISVIAYHDAG